VLAGMRKRGVSAPYKGKDLLHGVCDSLECGGEGGKEEKVFQLGRDRSASKPGKGDGAGGGGRAPVHPLKEVPPYVQRKAEVASERRKKGTGGS